MTDTSISLSPDGVNPPTPTPPPPRGRSTSRVRFDLDSNVNYPDTSSARRAGSGSRRSYSDSEETLSPRRHRHRQPRRRTRRDPSSQLFNDKYDRPPDAADSESDGTVDLPPRFDENGNRKWESSTSNELADRIQDLLAGRGPAGKLFKGIAGELMEGRSHGSPGGERRRGSRRGDD